MKNRQRLELTWIGKEERPRLEPRILLHDPEKSYHSQYDVPDPRLEHLDEEERRRVKYENILIHGDNLLALKALEQEFAGKVKCIYIDPPFNTGQAFEHYDDSLEHSLWLTLIRDRIELLHRLLAPDGVFVCHLDDSEQAYAKILCDEVFGRDNFLNQVAWERSAVAGLGQGGKFLVNTTEYILFYAKDAARLTLVKPKLLRPFPEKTLSGYNRILAHEGTKAQVDEFPSKSTGEMVKVFKHECHTIERIRWKKLSHDERRSVYVRRFEQIFRTFLVQKENAFQHDLISRMEGGNLYSVEYVPSRGKNEGKLTTNYYVNRELVAWLRDIAVLVDGAIIKNETLSDFWTRDMIPNAARGEGGVSFDRSKKPEVLLCTIINSCSLPGDLVLDSFAGSGTTGAVAHKMGRRWIMVELGEHCHTHIIPRMKKVIDGEDQGGISKAVGWKGGGGFRYYKLAPTLIQKDKYGNDVINPEYNAEMLAEAMCKHMGFRYAPSDEVYWIHGQSTERDYIYVTTQPLTPAHLQYLNEEVGPERSLLIMCTAFRGNPDNYENLTVKKIPKAVLGRCEFGRDDYSLEIRELPVREEPAEDDTDNGKPRGKERKKQTPSLFTQETGE